jgi:hypothetical protein
MTEVRVEVRGFDIDHRVEGFVREGQVLSVAVHEIQAGQIVPFSAKLYTGRFKSSPVEEAGCSVRVR